MGHPVTASSYLSPQIFSFSPDMSSLLDRIPYVPKGRVHLIRIGKSLDLLQKKPNKWTLILQLSNFLGCLDLHQGVKYATIFLTVLWVVYAIVSFFFLALGNISSGHFNPIKIFSSKDLQSSVCFGASLMLPVTGWWCWVSTEITGSTSYLLSSSPSSTSSGESSTPL